MTWQVRTILLTFPGDSKWPFHPLVGGHLTIPKGHLTIPKRSGILSVFLLVSSWVNLPNGRWVVWGPSNRGTPKNPILLDKGIPKYPNHRAPNHQFTISWMRPVYVMGNTKFPSSLVHLPTELASCCGKFLSIFLQKLNERYERVIYPPFLCYSPEN